MKRPLAYALGRGLPRLPNNIGIDQRNVRPGFCHFQVEVLLVLLLGLGGPLSAFPSVLPILP